MTAEATGASLGAVGAGGAGARSGLLRTMLRNPLTIAALVVLIAFVVIAIVQPWITPFPPNQVRLRATNAPPFTGEHLLGGDRFGRDIFSRLIASTRGALEGAVVLAGVAFVIGTTAGLIAGYFGRLLDAISMWIFSVIMAVPGVMILISIYTLLGTSTTVAMGVLGLLSAPGLFLMVRTLTRGVRGELYVDAAKVSGLSNVRIIGRHVLYAIRAPIILMTATLAGTGIAVQAGLQFLGLGDPGRPSWGGMMSDAFTNFYDAPMQLVWPAAALGLVTGAFSLVSIGLRDALEGTYVKPSASARRKKVAALLGNQPPGRTTGEPATADEPLLVIADLHIGYPMKHELTTVVSGVSLTVDEGEVVGVVGESGSGKSQTVFATLGLLPDEAIVARGSIRLGGVELLGLPEKRLAHYRGSQLAYVPQEPMANLDPTFTIGSQLVYGIRAQRRMPRRQARELALDMLDHVGIRDPRRVFAAYPHQISGGMAQRVLIAGAVARKPRLLVADEPTTALDVTIQAEVLDLLRAVQQENGMGVLIVTHNFGVVADMCDRVVVMRGGQIVEEGAVGRVFKEPRHEYTKMLLGSVLDNAAPRSPLGPEQGTVHV